MSSTTSRVGSSWQTRIEQMSKRVDFRKVLGLAILLRLVLLVYGEWQDAYMTVKYTDVDYRVFTDAARYCWEGDSPYKRATYRYTPLLALLLTPNIWLHHAFGKLLFVAGDLMAGWLIQQLLTLRGMPSVTAIKYSALWLLNPFVATISTRGNAESLLGALVLLVIYGLAVKRADMAAVIFGVAVQLKFYPIIYALPLWCLIDDDYTGYGANTSITRTNSTTRCTPTMKEQIYRFFVSGPRIRFGLIAGGVFLGLSLAMYALYEWDYLEHTYLYHVTRRDHRHNFSVWFYDMYLASYTAEGAPKLLAFLPQLIPVVVLGIVFASDPVFALFTQTFAFVAFNKVCTSQYFMWYLCLLPLVLADTRLSFRWRGASLIIMWIATQGAWLNYAYQLEFLGQNTFFAIWLSGLAFFMANIWILVELIQHHNYRAWFSQGKLRRVQFSS